MDWFINRRRSPLQYTSELWSIGVSTQLSGDGRSVKDFTRRRRWIRTRVPVISEGAGDCRADPLAPGEASTGEPGLVGNQSPIRLQEALSYPRGGILVRLLSVPACNSGEGSIVSSLLPIVFSLSCWC